MVKPYIVNPFLVMIGEFCGNARHANENRQVSASPQLSHRRRMDVHIQRAGMATDLFGHRNYPGNQALEIQGESSGELQTKPGGQIGGSWMYKNEIAVSWSALDY